MRNGAIVIPAYKPNNSLKELILELIEEFKMIVIVDDGSGEYYSELFGEIDEVFKSNPRVMGIVLKQQVNMGKGHALKLGFDYIIGVNNALAEDEKLKGVVTVDADGQHKLFDICNVFDGLEENPGKIILGCRTFDQSNIPNRSKIGNIITKKVFNWCCGINISDTQTGLRGIPTKYLKECCEISGERYEYETNMLIYSKNVGIELFEINIETIYEQGNPSSHFNPFLDSLSIYRVILSYSLSSLLSWFIDLVVFMICMGMGFPVIISNYIGRAISAGVNYNLNRTIVFGNKNDNIIPLIRYIFLLIMSGTTSAIIIIMVSALLPIRIGIIKVITELFLYFANYYIQHTFVFRNKRIDDVTDWTSYYKRRKSIFSTLTQRHTLRILEKYIMSTLYSDNNGEGHKGLDILELGGGNSCFAKELCKKISGINRYDIIDNNKYAARLFDEMDLPVEHESFCLDLLKTQDKQKRYDFVFSVGLIEHFKDKDIQKVIEKHFLNCTYGGTVLITFPTPTVKYKLVRGLMEIMDMWQFNDEYPLKYKDVESFFAVNGDIKSHFLNNKLMLTQYVVVTKKNS